MKSPNNISTPNFDDFATEAVNWLVNNKVAFNYIPGTVINSTKFHLLRDNNHPDDKEAIVWIETIDENWIGFNEVREFVAYLNGN